jgi:hypothetical protein
MIPEVTSFRGATIVSIALMGCGMAIVLMNAKDKLAYTKNTGTIQYLDTKYEQLPFRHRGDYRYLKVDTYPFVFEIYQPNSEPTRMTIDSLQVGDNIDIFYYETADTRNIRLNRFTQFIDKEGQPHFVRNRFKQKLGWAIVGLSVLLNALAFLFWKKGKLK